MDEGSVVFCDKRILKSIGVSEARSRDFSGVLRTCVFNV